MGDGKNQTKNQRKSQTGNRLLQTHTHPKPNVLGNQTETNLVVWVRYSLEATKKKRRSTSTKTTSQKLQVQ